MGLCMGFSMVSFFEMIFYCFTGKESVELVADPDSVPDPFFCSVGSRYGFLKGRIQLRYSAQSFMIIFFCFTDKYSGFGSEISSFIQRFIFPGILRMFERDKNYVVNLDNNDGDIKENGFNLQLYFIVFHLLFYSARQECNRFS